MSSKLGNIAISLSPMHIKLLLYTWFTVGDIDSSSPGVSAYIYGLKLKLRSLVPLDKRTNDDISVAM